jgi:hypothetical protein
MRFYRGPLLMLGIAALAAGSLALGASEVSEESTSAKLSFQAYPKWSFILPRETWKRADPYCGVAHAGDADGFLADQTGPMALEIDTNGDGRLDDKIKGAFGYAKLRGKNEDGERFAYAVRFKFDRGYKWASAGAMVGKLKGITFRVIDQNGNGTYNEFGVDAMVVGATDAASFLSKVVNLDGDLYELEISEDGHDVQLRPFSGETGILNLDGEYESRGDLVAAIVRLGKDVSFNVAGHANGLRVPEGKYDFHSGYTRKGLETAVIGRGKSRPMPVEAGESYTLEWGGPLVAEFDYHVSGETITVKPNVQFYGSGGEEYVRFQPDAKSPKILVKDRITGKLLDSGRFGGC